MQRLDYEYSVYHNQEHGLSGHTFDGPYQAYRQKTLFFLFKRLAYVFLNPVTDGLVQKPEDHRWSSYRCYVGMEGAPLVIDPTPVLRFLDEDLEVARRDFLRIVQEEAKDAKPSKSNRLTALEVHQQQFGWLLSEAYARRGRFPQVDP